MMQMLEKSKSPISQWGVDSMTLPRSKKRRDYQRKHIEDRCLHIPAEKRCCCCDVWFSWHGSQYGSEVWALRLLQGEGSVVTRLALPTEMLLSPQAQATPRKLSDNTEGDGDAKTGNTCNALSGTWEQPLDSSALMWFHTNLSLLQVPSQGFPTSSVSGERVGEVVSTRRSPAAAWPPHRCSTHLFTAWLHSNAASWTLALTCCRNNLTGAVLSCLRLTVICGWWLVQSPGWRQQGRFHYTIRALPLWLLFTVVLTCFHLCNPLILPFLSSNGYIRLLHF